MTSFLADRKDRADRTRIKQEAEDRFAKDDDRQMREDLHTVMSTPAGRRLYMAMLHRGGLFAFTHRDDNHAYICGKRDSALEVWKIVTYRESPLANLAQQERDTLRLDREKKLRALMNNAPEE